MKRKFISTLFALVLVLSFSLVTAVPVAAAEPAEVWVDDGFTEAACGGHNWGIDAFATIQEGITAVGPSGTVHVANGDYMADTTNSILLVGGVDPGYCFVHIDKPITLVGESRDGVILDGTGLQGQVRSTGIWVSVSNVTVKNLTIRNFTVTTPDKYCYGLVSWEKFRNFNTAEPHVLPLSYVTAENLKVIDCQASLYFMMTEHATVKDCIVEGSSADGIWIAMGSSYANVQGNTVKNSADHGIWVGGASWCPPVNCPNATIIDNTINGAREGGISFVGSDGASISENIITNVAGEDPSVGGWSVGALSLKDGCSNVEAFNNNIHGNDGSWGGYSGTGHGVGIDGTPSNINLYLNNIYDNSGDGCHNYSTVAVNAINNWWGDPTGPGGEGPGTGDEASTYVDFDPWLSGGLGAYAWIDTNLNSAFDLGESHFATIQAAIDFANPGDTIAVAAGTYVENLIIPTENLILEGAQAGVDPTVEGARTILAEESTVTGAVTIKASDIVVDGFRIEGTVYVDDSVSAITDATISNNYITGASYGIRVGTASNNVISQLIIEYNAIIDNANKGICFWKVDWQAGNLHDVTIRDNTISGNVGGGISTYGAGPYFVVDNTVTGNQGNGISLKYDDGDIVTGNIVTDNDAMGINMHEVTNCVVEDNTVSGHTSADVITTFWGTPEPVGKGSGIYLHEDSTDNIIRFNDLTGNRNGVLINNEEAGDPPSANSINYNNVTGNIDYGVLNATPSLVDATYNWWGDETGPEHATLNPGAKGNAVSENVAFSPWLYKTQEDFIPGEPSYAGSVVLGNEATLVEPGSYAGGWNTFSTPILLDSSADTVGELLDLVAGSGLSIVRAQRFDPVEGWVALVMGGSLIEDYQIKPGEGFFIQVSTKGSLPILCSTQLFPPQSRELSLGWNLVGAPSYLSKLVEDGLASLSAATVVNSPGANPASWSYPPAAVSKVLLPGRAYWVAMSADGTLMCFDGTPVADYLTWELNH